MLRNVNEVSGTYSYCCSVNVLSCVVKYSSLHHENKTCVIKRNEIKRHMCKVRYAISTSILLTRHFTCSMFLFNTFSPNVPISLAFILPRYSGPWRLHKIYLYWMAAVVLQSWYIMCIFIGFVKQETGGWPFAAIFVSKSGMCGYNRTTPIAVAERSRARTVFARSNTAIVGSNPTYAWMFVFCVRFFCFYSLKWDSQPT
jgi:hypothetical protein